MTRVTLRHPLLSTAAIRWQRKRRREYLTAVALSLAVAGGGCDSLMLAPDGSSIVISANPLTVATEGDSAVITLLAFEADGVKVEDGTEISVYANAGQLCALQATQPNAAVPSLNKCSATSPGAITVTTLDGIASALYRSGPAAGSVTISARSGTVTNTVTLTLSGLAAPAGSVIAAQAEPDTIGVNEVSRITAFISSTSGPAPNGTKVVFSAPDTAVQHPLATTQDGFVQTTVIGRKTGILSVAIVSGAVKDTIRVVVK